jgi:hypothetical protein
MKDTFDLTEEELESINWKYVSRQEELGKVTRGVLWPIADRLGIARNQPKADLIRQIVSAERNQAIRAERTKRSNQKWIDLLGPDFKLIKEVAGKVDGIIRMSRQRQQEWATMYVRDPSGALDRIGPMVEHAEQRRLAIELVRQVAQPRHRYGMGPQIITLREAMRQMKEDIKDNLMRNRLGQGGSLMQAAMNEHKREAQATFFREVLTSYSWDVDKELEEEEG